MRFFLAYLKPMKKRLGSGVGSISQRYGSGDPDPHFNGSPTMHTTQSSVFIRQGLSISPFSHIFTLLLAMLSLSALSSSRS
jgi:hypothetical protein